MKHGRRHNKLKEQTYKRFARRGVEGYHHEYRPMESLEGNPDAEVAEAEETPSLAHVLNPRVKKGLRRLGVNPDDADDE